MSEKIDIGLTFTTGEIVKSESNNLAQNQDILDVPFKVIHEEKPSRFFNGSDLDYYLSHPERKPVQ